MVSDPPGALVALHDAEPEDERLAVQRVTDPAEKVTVPVGVPEPGELAVTVAL